MPSLSTTLSHHHAKLSNGLHVVGELSDDALSVALGFFVNTGSRDESQDIAGVSHFLEHMVFKGTERRDALAVNRDLDRIGARHNAQTSEEDTVFHVTSLPEYLPSACDILADIMRPSLRESDFETEKQVILEEIEMYQDSPMAVAYERVRELHFSDHPLGHSVLGTRESVGGMRIEQMCEYYQSRYAPSNITLAVSGKADWPAVVALAEKHCGGWGGQSERRIAVPTKGKGGFDLIARPADLQQSTIMVADFPPLESSDRYAATLLSTILGDHTGSRLYWALVDPGFADAAECAYHDFSQAGALFLYLSCEPELAQANLKRIRDLLGRFVEGGPTEAEVEQAKNKVCARHVLRGERPFSRLMQIGFQWTYERRLISVDEELELYARVTIDDLRRILRQYQLWPMTIVSAGPSADLLPPE